MNNFKTTSIKDKLLVAFLLTSLLGLFLLSITLVIMEKDKATKTLREELTTMADIVAWNSSAALMFNDRNGAGEVLASIAGKPDIIIASLYDKHGQKFTSYTRSGISPDILATLLDDILSGDENIAGIVEKQGEIAITKENHCIVVRPVSANGQLIGAILLIDDMQQLKNRSKSFYTVLSLAVVVILLIVFFVSSWVQKLFTVPLTQIMHTIEKVTEENDYTIQIKKQSEDEFGELIDHFNKMIHELHNRDEERKSYSSNLEKTVANRTSALSQAKTELEATVADLEVARDLAEESNRAKSQFLANMSHEIRTPMNGVLGMTELLLETELTRSQQQFANIIQESGNSLLTIINDILDFAKIESGKLELEPGQFNLQELLEDIVQLLSTRNSTQGIELSTLIQPDTQLYLKGDAHRLRQILINLLGNALKFTSEGEVVIQAKTKATESGVDLSISVTDTGIGISKENLKKLFKPFSQADGTSTRKYGGTGLGLVISMELVALMGGTLQVKSELGQGSVFYFTIPLEIASSENLHPIYAATNSLEGLKVLVIDDNPTNRKIISHQTSSWNMLCDTAESGSTGLQILENAQDALYDIILLDLDMPMMDGMEVARRIKANPRISDIPIIMLTSVGNLGDAKRSKNAGIDIYLTKPVRQKNLFSAILAAIHGIDVAQIELSHGIHSDQQKVVEVLDSGLQILLVEDNSANQLLASMVLKQFGCRIDTAVNGAEAVKAFKEKKFDLILMDCQMPVMDGFQATRKIREIETTMGGDSHIPIIALTANALKGDRERCINAGMDDYLSKPFSLNQIRSLLSHWFDLSAPVNQNSVDDPPKTTTNRDLPGNHKDKSVIVLDTSVLNTIKTLQIADEPDLLSEVITTFLAATDKILNELNSALQQHETTTIKRHAHTLKSSSAGVGALSLSDVSRSLEYSCETNSSELNKELVSKIEAEYNLVKTALEKEVV
ncbi:MAG TPA: response regulator [Desulfocapsa sulfexigens]|nr:response regulator [Desulfocapsa sulfexigens]